MKKSLGRNEFIKIYEELNTSILFSDFNYDHGYIAKQNKAKRDGIDNVYLLTIASFFIVFHKNIYNHIMQGEMTLFSLFLIGMIFVCMNILLKRRSDIIFNKKMPEYYLLYHLAKDEFKIIVQLFYENKAFFVGDKVRVGMKTYTIEKISYLDRKVELSDHNRLFFEELTYIK